MTGGCLSADEDAETPEKRPALFATIHFKSERRSGGYTAEQVERLNRWLNEAPDKTGE